MSTQVSPNRKAVQRLDGFFLNAKATASGVTISELDQMGTHPITVGTMHPDEARALAAILEREARKHERRRRG